MEENLQKAGENFQDKTIYYYQLYLDYFNKWRDLKNMYGDQKYLDYVYKKKEEAKEPEIKLSSEEIKLYSIIRKFMTNLNENPKPLTTEIFYKDVFNFIEMIIEHMKKQEKDMQLLQSFTQIYVSLQKNKENSYVF